MLDNGSSSQNLDFLPKLLYIVEMETLWLTYSALFYLPKKKWERFMFPVSAC